MELLVATHNIGKVRELQQVLRELPITLRYLKEFPHIAAIDETGSTYEQNAILKAMGYAEQTGLCALADDSGLEVDALGGKPGVFSARFGGEGASDQDRTQKLLGELLPYQSQERAARFICCMALAGESGRRESQDNSPQVLNVSEAVCEGTIAFEPSGTGGFGYDPVFIPNGYSETFAELPKDVKAAISHRGKALAAMRAFLTQFLKAT